MRWQTLGRAALWTIVLLPLIFHASRLPTYGRLQVDDYYGVLWRLSDGDVLSDDLHEWYRIRIGPHRVLVPALVWYLNIALTGGNNLALAAFCLVLLAAIFVFLVRSLPDEVRCRSPECWLFALFLSTAVFAPVVAHNLGRAFAGSHYFLADFFALLAMTVLTRNGTTPRALAGILGLGVLAALTFSSGLALWPALLIGAIHLRIRGRGVLLLVAAAALSTVVYAFPGPAREAASPTFEEVFEYVIAFLGGALTRDVEIAVVLGGCGFFLFLSIQLRALIRRAPERTLALWTMVQTYAIANAILAALGRSDRGVEQALTVRYSHFSSLFWGSLFVAAGLLLLRAMARHRRLVLAGLALILVVSTAAMLRRGLRIMSTEVTRGELQPLAELAVVGDYWDSDLVQLTISRNPSTVIRAIPLLKSLQHVPFDRPPQKPAMGRTIPRDLLSRVHHPDVQGCFCKAWTTVDRSVFRVRGSAGASASAIEDLVIVDPGGRERSVVVRDMLRRDPDGKGSNRRGWDGFVLGWSGLEPEESLSRLDAFVRLRGDPAWYPLPKTFDRPTPLPDGIR